MRIRIRCLRGDSILARRMPGRRDGSTRAATERGPAETARPTGGLRRAVGVLAVAAALALPACATARPADDPELRALAAAMTGTFSSRAQHERAPDDYFDIRLVMVPVWEQRDDGPWLYVEQAIAARADAPYRQRVYRLVREGPDAFASEIYTLPGDPKQFAATWREKVPLCCVKLDELTLRSGCTVHLRRTPDGSWEGGTEGDGCASDLRGARHATTQIRLSDGLLQAWDRGFAADGSQVWGPTAGPYEFVRVSRTAP